MVDGVADEVLQNAANAARIQLRFEVSARRDQSQLRALRLGERCHRFDRVVDKAHNVGRLNLHVDRAGVVAAHLE